mgnify:FL=1
MKKQNNTLFTGLIIIFFIIIALISFNIYNAYKNTKDVTLLSEYIVNNTEIVNNKEGLTKENGTYIFKGELENNYVLYNNMLWRIIKINSDSSLELILDDYINMLPKNLISTFFENLESNIDLDYLIENNICKDTFDNENNITCQKLEKDKYVSLLSVYDYINSFYDNKTFITNDKDKLWLYNNDAHTNGDKLSTSNENNFYEIKPVITIKNSTLYKSGNGTKNNPYQIGNNDFSIGAKVQINNDMYIVYDFKDNIKLMSLNTIDKIYKNNVLDYLNNEYYQKLSYKNILKDTVIYNGKYSNKENDITKTQVTKKIGIPSILDIKFESDIKDYYLANKVNDFDLIYNNPVIYGDKKTLHQTRYTITLDKKEINNFTKENNVYIYKEGTK